LPIIRSVELFLRLRRRNTPAASTGIVVKFPRLDFFAVLSISHDGKKPGTVAVVFAIDLPYF
jgi:hypothetical protein